MEGGETPPFITPTKTRIISPEKLNFVRFILNTQVYVTKRKSLNWVLFIIFFILLFINISTPAVQLNDPKKPEISYGDVFCLISSLSLARDSEDFVYMAVIISQPITLAILVIVIISMAASTSVIPFITRLYSMTIFYLLPCLIFILNNSFLNLYTLIGTINNSIIEDVFTIVLHIFIVIYTVLLLLITSNSSLYTVHPFIARNSHVGCIMALFYMYTFLFGSYVLARSKYVIYFNTLVYSIFIIIFCIFPITSHRFSNSMYLAASIHALCVDVICFTKIQDVFILVSFFASIVFSLIYNYFVFPQILKCMDSNAFYFAFTERPEKWSVEDINVLSRKETIDAVNMALQIDNKFAIPLISHYSKHYIYGTASMFFAWQAYSIYQLKHDKITQPVKIMLERCRKKIDTAEKSFWLAAWLADKAALPALSSQLSSNRTSYNNLIDFYSHQFTNFESESFEPVLIDKERAKQPLWMLILNIILLLLYIGGNICVYFLIKLADDAANGSSAIQRFNSAVLDYQKDWFIGKPSVEVATQMRICYIEIRDAIPDIQEIEDLFILDHDSIPYVLFSHYAKIMDDIFAVYNEYLQPEKTIFQREVPKLIFYGVVIIPCLYSIVISLYLMVVGERHLKLFEVFKRLPKQIFASLGEFMPSFEFKINAPKESTPNLFRAMPRLITYLLIQILLVISMSIILGRSLVMIEYDISSVNRTLINIGHLNRIELGLANMMSAAIVNDQEEFLNAFYTTDELICKLSHNEDQTVMNILPDNIMTFMSHAYTSKTALFNSTVGAELLSEFSQKIATFLRTMSNTQVFNIGRLISYIVCTVILFVAAGMLLNLLYRYAAHEQECVLYLIERAVGSHEISPTNTTLASFDELEMPYMAIDPNFKVEYISETGESAFGARIGMEIAQTALPVSMKAGIMTCIEKFSHGYFTKAETIPSALPGNALYLQPRYQYAEFRMNLENVYIVECRDHAAELSSIRRRVEMLKDVAMPPSNKNPNPQLLSVVCFPEVPDFLASIDMDTAVRMRQEMSRRFVSILDEEGCAVCHLFEAAGLFVGQLRDVKADRWMMHMAVVPTVNKIAEAVLSVGEEYGQHFTVMKMIFKTKAAPAPQIDAPMAYPGLQADSMFVAMSRLKYCATGYVNYTTEAQERRMRPKYTSLVKMEPANIFIIV